MAILPGVSQISVAVMMDSRPAPEYEYPRPRDERREPFEARCYIEAQDGKPYGIRYRVSPLFHFPGHTDTLIIAILIDGQLIYERCVSKTELKDHDDYIEEIWRRPRKLTDGSSEYYSMVFKEVTTVEEADQKTTEADTRRMKTFGIIRVDVIVAKEKTNRSIAPSLDDGHLAFSQKTLALHPEQSHGTSYLKIDGDYASDSSPVHIEYEESRGKFLFFCRSHEFVKHCNILDPHEAHGMRHSAQDDRVSVMSNGRLLIDLTRSP